MTTNKTKPKILIIDDDQSLHSVFTRILTKEGYTIENAETGKEALQKIQNQTFDAALIDVKLPDINGLDLLPQLNKTAPSMIKLVITGFEIPDGKNVALKLGADDFFKKPLHPDVLLKALKDKLKTKKPAF
jgi:DNA-binding NtrC family response regulator